MSIGSGIAGSFGAVAETVYGTYVAPTRWYEAEKADLKKVKNTVQGNGLAAGRLMPLGVRRVVTTHAGGGSVPIQFSYSKMGLLLNNLIGGTTTVAQQAATAAYLQTTTAADNVGKFLTLQAGVPDVGGTVRPYTFKGSKIISAEFSCGVDEILSSVWEFDSKVCSEVETLAAPSVTASAPFHFGQMTVKLGTFASEAAVTGVKKVTVKIERPQDVGRFYAGATIPGTKDEPIMSDNLKVTGSFEVDYITKGDFADRFAADTATAFVWEFVGPTAIASTYFPTFRLKVPQIFFDEGTPTVDGNGIVTTTFNFTTTFDGTNGPVISEYMTTDTAI